MLEHRDGGRQGLDKVRRILDHAVALPHGFAHKAEFAVLEVTDAAMRHVRRSRRCARTEVRAFHDQYIHAVEGQVAEVPMPLMPAPMIKTSTDGFVRSDEMISERFMFHLE